MMGSARWPNRRQCGRDRPRDDLPILSTLERPMRPPGHPSPGRRAVGNTPLSWITAVDTPDGRGFWAKLEGSNPRGIKDRAGLHMVRAARRRGDLAPGAPIVESTSGTQE
jgi:hypothetical protein